VINKEQVEVKEVEEESRYRRGTDKGDIKKRQK
jgi:hypothetical protein